MTPHAALIQLSIRRSQAGDRIGHLTVCSVCREALLDDLESHFTGIESPVTRRLDGSPIMVTRSLEGSQIMGFTFSDGPQETCALHALLHEEERRG